MNADQISEIRPAIREAVDGAPDTCVTFEIEGDPERWLQVKDHTINAAYPYPENPEKMIKLLPSVLLVVEISGWEPKKFATFEIGDFEVTDLSEWIDAYFVRVLNCAEGEYHVDTAFEKL